MPGNSQRNQTDRERLTLKGKRRPFGLSRLLAMTLTTVAAAPSLAADVYGDFPVSIDPDARYVVYSHGLIVEGDNPRPEHPQFGTYDFPGIVQALFEDGGFTLIAPHRPANADVASYIAKLESGVHALIDAGVPPTRITLVGFSRGAQMTAVASSRLADIGINTALMAICLDGDFSHDPSLTLGGNLLSIYETTDVVGSCAALAERSVALESFDEIAISTGRSHGAFYTPRTEWMQPLKRWIAATNR
jgi:pimeloyl-ACP methyl ester carboxylesterase